MEKNKINGKNTLKHRLLATGLAASIAITGAVGLSGCGDSQEPVQPKVEQPADPSENLPQEDPAGTPSGEVFDSPEKMAGADEAYKDIMESAEWQAQLMLDGNKNVDPVASEIISITITSDSQGIPNGYIINYINISTGKPDLLSS